MFFPSDRGRFGFDAIGRCFDASSAVRLHSSLSPSLDAVMPHLFRKRSPPVVFRPPAAYGSLKPAPTSRFRRTFLHLRYSTVPKHVLDTTLSNASSASLR